MKEQDIIAKLVNEVEELEDDEFEKMYSQLSVDGKNEIDDFLRDFADNAIGDPNWDSDETGGYFRSNGE